MTVELLSITPDAEEIIEHAGRVCYLSDGHDPEIITRWIKSGHESVIEHAVASFHISGISRACSHQLVRHRLASYSQQSQRYVSEDQFEYVIPDSIKHSNYCKAIYEDAMSLIQTAYKALVEVGIKKEDARFVLPNACTTEIVMTANFREWRTILKLRLDKHAQWEIRSMCGEIARILIDKAPHVFSDLKELIFN
jgi:thymidylate synthase (FAD)